MQFSLKGVLAGVTVLALGMAAIMLASATIASIIYTVYFGWIALSLVATFVCRGRARSYWLGSLVFGAMYYHLTMHSLWPGDANLTATAWGSYGFYSTVYSPDPSGELANASLREPELITTRLLDRIAAATGAALIAGQHVQARFMGGSFFPGQIVSVHEGDALVAWDDGMPKQSAVRTADIFPDGLATGRGWIRQTGQSVFGLCCALLGGWLCWAILPWQTSTSTKTGVTAEPKH
jgi:hypothetical protein